MTYNNFVLRVSVSLAFLCVYLILSYPVICRIPRLDTCNTNRGIHNSVISYLNGWPPGRAICTIAFTMTYVNVVSYVRPPNYMAVRSTFHGCLSS
ncbi:hypothetical protein EDD17DRAFT_1519948 [Pisolithus thermaeus]|nr:hypothetical protein EDD17DRAFT_1519948 [Pisolithus thermaeus]